MQLLDDCGRESRPSSRSYNNIVARVRVAADAWRGKHVIVPQRVGHRIGICGGTISAGRQSSSGRRPCPPPRRSRRHGGRRQDPQDRRPTRCVPAPCAHLLLMTLTPIYSGNHIRHSLHRPMARHPRRPLLVNFAAETISAAQVLSACLRLRPQSPRHPRLSSQDASPFTLPDHFCRTDATQGKGPSRAPYQLGGVQPE